MVEYKGQEVGVLEEQRLQGGILELGSAESFDLLKDHPAGAKWVLTAPRRNEKYPILHDEDLKIFIHNNRGHIDIANEALRYLKNSGEESVVLAGGLVDLIDLDEDDAKINFATTGSAMSLVMAGQKDWNLTTATKEGVKQILGFSKGAFKRQLSKNNSEFDVEIR